MNEPAATRGSWLTDVLGLVGLGLLCSGIGAKYGLAAAAILAGAVLLGLAMVAAWIRSSPK